MPLTTVANGRTYDWIYAIGRGAASGPGFNYPQAMCLGRDGDLFVANRGNENNFGQRVNRLKLGGAGDEEQIAEFFTYGDGDGKSIWPFGVAVDSQHNVYVADEWTNTISVFHTNGTFVRKFGRTGSGEGEFLHPAGLACDSNDNLIVVDSGNNRLQIVTGEGKFIAQCGKAGSGEGEFNQPWGVTVDTDGNIYVADWKNHRVQKLSPEGRFLMQIGEYGTPPVAKDAYAVTYLGPYISSLHPDSYPKAGLLNHPTDVAVDNDGDIYIADWGNHRISIFDREGRPITNLMGDAQVMSKWGQQVIDANPDMRKALRRVRNLEPQWRFCFPTAVDFNPATDEIIVADSQRNRLQVYRKIRDYVDFQANL
ncbi:MAG TPA: NHL repeat-containing protein [Rhodopila sp.]|nr:NHL repeat-containing protein [Rhodopila sp.]